MNLTEEREVDAYLLLVHITSAAGYVFGRYQNKNDPFSVERCHSYREYQNLYRRYLEGKLNLQVL